MTNRNIAVDFDGVLHKYSLGWHDGSIYDDPIEGVDEALAELSKRYRVIVFTTRADTDDREQEVWGWLEKHDLAQYVSVVSACKPPAMFYIDDRAIRHVDWTQTLREISQYEAEA